MAAPGQSSLRGRSRERHELDAALERVLGGESAVLVLRGEAGIGKTTLLTYVAEHASSRCRVLRVAGVESELELPFAALHQLCGPLIGEVEAVPDHQQRALKVALGLEDG